MQKYILIKDLKVQNANAVSGLTYGFPSITNFLGFAHAMSRELIVDKGVYLEGVAVVSHTVSTQAYMTEVWGDKCFALTRNPLDEKGATQPITEEGRLFMQVSLFIEINGAIPDDEEEKTSLVEHIKEMASVMRLAGGQVVDIGSCELIEDLSSQHIAMRTLVGGCALIDRSEYLASHYLNMKKENPGYTHFDAWTDFIKIKFEAVPVLNSDNKELSSDEDTSKAIWHYIPKPNAGYLVPIMVGYKTIADIAPAGTIKGVRDTSLPVAFSEAVHSVGEWKSIYRLGSLHEAIWNYAYEPDWYVAKANLAI